MSALIVDSSKLPPPVTTAAEVNIALARYFAHPQFGIVFEVARATGYNARRHIDAMAMGLWPSRGLDLYAIEVKVSRADYRREIDNPAKAEEMAEFCDFFYIAAPYGLIKHHELPKAWGLLELTPKGIVEAVQPHRLAGKKDYPKHFLAAVFRAASRPVSVDEVSVMLKTERAKLEAGFEARVDRALEDRKGRDHRAAEQWRELCRALEISDWSPADDVVRAVRLVIKSGITSAYGGIRKLLESKRQDLARLEEIAAELPPDEPSGKLV